MASAEPRLITLEEMELLSFLWQNVLRKLSEEAERQGLSERHPHVVQVVVAYFKKGPLPHHIFNRLVWRLAHSF